MKEKEGGKVSVQVPHAAQPFAEATARRHGQVQRVISGVETEVWEAHVWVAASWDSTVLLFFWEGNVIKVLLIAY